MGATVTQKKERNVSQGKKGEHDGKEKRRKVR